jgi:hypothetical protein
VPPGFTPSPPPAPPTPASSSGSLSRCFSLADSSTGASQVTYNPAYREPFSRIGVACEFLPDVDHTLSNLHAQRVLTASILRWDLDEDSRDGRQRRGDLRGAPEGLTA